MMLSTLRGSFDDDDEAAAAMRDRLSRSGRGESEDARPAIKSSMTIHDHLVQVLMKYAPQGACLHERAPQLV